MRCSRRWREGLVGDRHLRLRLPADGEVRLPEVGDVVRREAVGADRGVGRAGDVVVVEDHEALPGAVGGGFDVDRAAGADAAGAHRRAVHRSVEVAERRARGRQADRDAPAGLAVLCLVNSGMAHVEECGVLFVHLQNDMAAATAVTAIGAAEGHELFTMETADAVAASARAYFNGFFV